MKLLLTTKPLICCKSILQEGSVPTSKAKWTSILGTFSAANAETGFICTKARPLSRKTTIFNAAVSKAEQSNCTTHYIRECALDQIVLHNLKMVTAFAREQSEEFYDMATQNGEAEANRFYKTAEREKVQTESCICELDNIIRRLYEDRVSGRITPERYDTMSNGYEQE